MGHLANGVPDGASGSIFCKILESQNPPNVSIWWARSVGLAMAPWMGDILQVDPGRAAVPGVLCMKGRWVINPLGCSDARFSYSS